MAGRSHRARAAGRLVAAGRDEGGLALVEFALVLPFFVATFLSVIDVGMALFTRAQLQTAAQAGADYAAVRGFDSAKVSAAASGATSTPVTVPTPVSYYACDVSGTLTTVDAGTTCTSGQTAGRYASVTVNATYNPFLSTVWKTMTGSDHVALSITVIGPTS